MLLMIIITIVSILISNIISCKYLAFRVLGVNFEPNQINNDEFKEIIKNYKIKVTFTAFLIIACDIAIDKLLEGDVPFLTLIFSVVVYLLLNSLFISKTQNKMMELKEKNGWIEEAKVLYADTKLLTQKSKKGIPTIIIWLIWLIWPFAIIIQSLKDGGRSLDFISFIGPIIYLFMPLIYPFVINTKVQPISEDSSINLAYASRIQKNNSIFFILICLFCELPIIMLDLFGSSSREWIFIVFLIIMILGTFLIVFIQIINQSKIDKEFSAYKTLETKDDANNYKYGMYYNKNDSRLLVPKSNPAFGWTINFAKRSGKILLFSSLLIVLLLVGGVFYISSIDIDYKLAKDELEIKAPMYNRSLNYTEIEEVKLSDERISAYRTNGYGGIKKSYGHFDVKGYGNTMYYCYNDIPERIFIKVKGKCENWYILNEKTKDQTRRIYESLSNKVKENK